MSRIEKLEGRVGNLEGRVDGLEVDVDARLHPLQTLCTNCTSFEAPSTLFTSATSRELANLQASPPRTHLLASLESHCTRLDHADQDRAELRTIVEDLQRE